MALSSGDDTWQIDGELFVAHQYQECNVGEYLATGFVAEPGTLESTGNAFMLIERDGVVIHVWQAPLPLWERLQSMIDLMLTDYYERIDGDT